MEKTSAVPEQSEKQNLLLEDGTSNDQPIEQKNPECAWSFSNTLNDSDKALLAELIHILFSLPFQLAVLFHICIIDILAATLYTPCCYKDDVLRIIFVVQGSCGVFVVFVHTCVIVFE